MVLRPEDLRRTLAPLSAFRRVCMHELWIVKLYGMRILLVLVWVVMHSYKYWSIAYFRAYLRFTCDEALILSEHLLSSGAILFFFTNEGRTSKAGAQLREPLGFKSLPFSSITMKLPFWKIFKIRF